MRARLIANPVAGTDAAFAGARALNDRLKGRFGPLDIVLTAASGDAREAARDAALGPYDYVFVAGGDGTLNETINGLGAVPAGLERIAIGVLPFGTGNDFAAALGLPADPEAALHAILDGRERRVDLGRVNGRLFANVSAGGFIADVSEAVTPPLKSVAGRFAYLIGGARALLAAEPFDCTLDGKPHSCLMFAVCNAPMIGGGRLIAPDARPDDGRLDVCLVSAMPMAEFVALLRRVADGTHVDDERVTYFTTDRASLLFERPINVNADGEPFETDRCDYEVLPGAARFLAGA